MSMRVFVTGARGLVGRTLGDGLRDAGHEVIAPPRSELDLLDRHSLETALRAAKPDLVIHAAGKVGGIQANIDAPVEFLYENMLLGMNVIGVSSDVGIPRLINLGSSCMYPREAPNPLVEETILTGRLEPTNEGYAIAKIAAAKLAEYINRERSLQYTTLIPCNLYGPYDKFRQGAHMIPAAIAKVHDALQSGSDSVEIWGDGTARREFMYAGDLADFIAHLIEHPDRTPDLVNVGVGSDHSVNEYYEIVADVLGYRGGFSHDLSKPSGMAQKLVDTQRLRATGWRPGTSLADGIAKTYDYFLKVER